MSLHEEALETVLFSGGGPHKLRELIELFYKENEKSLILAMTYFSSDTVKYIGENPQFSDLKTLSLELGWIETEDLRFLLSSPNLQNLETLNLRMLRCEPTFPEEAISKLKLKNLKKLDIQGIRMSKEHWKIFSNNENFQSLKSLGLGACFMSDKGIKNIAKSQNFKNLERLDLSGCDFNFGEDEVLFASSSFPNLKELDINRSHLSSEALRNLFTNENFKGLEKINFLYNLLGESITPEFRDYRVTFKGLKKALFGINFLTTDTLKILIEVFSPAALERLDLWGNILEAEGCKALVESKMLESVRFLNLRGTGIDDEGIKHLAQANLSNLEILVMSGVDITDAGLNVFLGSQSFENLKHLDIESSKVSWQEVNLDWNATLPKIEYFIVPKKNKAEDILPERIKPVLKEFTKRFEDEEGYNANN